MSQSRATSTGGAGSEHLVAAQILAWEGRVAQEIDATGCLGAYNAVRSELT